MDFAALPPEIYAERIAEPVTPGARETGNGRRDLRGVLYAAAPPSERETGEEDARTGPTVRKITGVDIMAVPPQR